MLLRHGGEHFDRGHHGPTVAATPLERRMLPVVLVIAVPPDAIVVLQTASHADDLASRVVQVFAVAGESVPANEKRATHIKVVNPNRASHYCGTPKCAVRQARLLVAD